MARHRQFSYKIISYFLILFVILGVIGVVIGVSSRKTDAPQDEIAKVEITLNGTTLEEMKDGEKETKYPDNQLKVTDQGIEESYDEVEIKGRGNLSWGASKKPWQIKFDKRTDFLGIARAKKWAFLTNYYDKSYIRSDLAEKVVEMVGVKYNHRGRFAEVAFDGEYEGLFYILPRIEIGKDGVNLKDELGVVVELDNFRRDATDTRYFTYAGDTLLLKDAVLKNDETKKQEAMEQFLDGFNKLEKYAERGNYDRVAEVADLESFAEYFLVSEFTANPDAYTTSFYFYKDGPSDKIHAGPMWDLDLAFSNETWGELSATKTMERRAKVFGEDGNESDTITSRLVYYLMDMPEFQKLVKKIYRERLAGRKDELMKEARIIKETVRDYAISDSEKWGRGDYDTEAEKVIDWVNARYDYFDEVYGDKSQEMEKSVI